MLINLLIGDKHHNIFYLFFQLMDSFLRIPKRYIMVTKGVYRSHLKKQKNLSLPSQKR